MNASYIIDAARKAGGLVAVFHHPQSGHQWKVMPLQGERFERVVGMLGIQSCIGVYNDECPPDWIQEDIRFATRRLDAA